MNESDTIVPVPALAYKRNGRAAKARVLAMQRALFAETMKEGTKPSDRAACARTYDVLEDRLRVLNGKLKPGSVNESRRGVAEPERKSKRAKGEVVVLASPADQQANVGLPADQPQAGS